MSSANISNSKGYGISGLKINGIRYLPGITPDFVETYPEIPTRNDDVIIDTWLKSGK